MYLLRSIFKTKCTVLKFLPPQVSSCDFLVVHFSEFTSTILEILILTETALQACSLGKGVVKICSKFAVEHLCQTVISINLQSNFIDVTLRHGFSPVNLLHIFRITFYKNTSTKQWVYKLYILSEYGWGVFSSVDNVLLYFHT